MKRHLFQFIEIVTVGFPFCAFKVLTGMVLAERPWLRSVGWLLVAVGGLDFFVNAINSGSLMLGRPRALGVCMTEMLARAWRPGRPEWHDLGVSADVVLSFVLVAIMIGFDLLPALPPIALHVWSIAVVLNVIGAGFGRLSSSLASLKEPAKREVREESAV